MIPEEILSHATISNRRYNFCMSRRSQPSPSRALVGVRPGVPALGRRRRMRRPVLPTHANPRGIALPGPVETEVVGRPGRHECPQPHGARRRARGRRAGTTGRPSHRPPSHPARAHAEGRRGGRGLAHTAPRTPRSDLRSALADRTAASSRTPSGSSSTRSPRSPAATDTFSERSQSVQPLHARRS